MIQEPEFPEYSSREIEIERRLKQARPRPLRLDVAALERLALRPMDDAVVEVSHTGHRRWRDNWSIRRALGIAASWTCGAIVGALVTFVLTHHARLGVAPTRGADHREQQTTAPAVLHPKTSPTPEIQRLTPAEIAAIPASPPTFDPRAFAMEMLLDRWRKTDSNDWQQGPTLRAGMHLSGFEAVSSRPRPDTADAVPINSAGASTETRQRWKSAPEQPQPITRERLLRDVLQASGSVL